MHLAILMTNTDESDFAQRHPKDGEKFTSLIQNLHPDWKASSYAVKDGIFPDDITAFDGIMITGSPASVLDDAVWITRLLSDIRTAYAAGLPMFGACFGHQAIALALGGTVEKNPGGWTFGLVEILAHPTLHWYEGPETLLQYSAHIDHVSTLPDGARQVFSADHCRNAGFVIGNRVYTTQNHPEISPSFMNALVEEYASALGPDLADRARQSLSRVADAEVFARSIVRFFEDAVALGMNK